MAKAGGWVTLLFLSGFAHNAFSCSTFVLRQGDHIVFGRNYDYSIGYGLIFVNQSGLRKTPFQVQPSALSWNAKYGSISFNEYGKEAPFDGMNQSGLVIAQMWLDGTGYPAADSRPPVGVLAWIQYQLDNSATVQDVLRTDSAIRISPDNSPLHFLVADRTGDAAVVEFLSGRMVVHRGADLPVSVLTNSRYDDSVACLRDYVGFGGNTPIPSSSGSLSRFVRAAYRVSRYGAGDPTPIVTYAFATLSSIAQSITQWTGVYDMTERKVYFKTKQSSDIKSFQFDGLDYLCRTIPGFLDVDIAAGGDVTGLFQPYTLAANRDLIYKAFRGTDLPFRSTPDWALDVLAALPDSFACCRPKPWVDKTRIPPPVQTWKKVKE